MKPKVQLGATTTTMMMIVHNFWSTMVKAACVEIPGGKPTVDSLF